MIQRTPENSPTLAYIVTILPFVVFAFFYYSLYSIERDGVFFNFYSYVFLCLFVLLMLCSIVYFADVFVPKFILFLVFGVLAVSVSLACIAVYNYLSSYSFNIMYVVRKAFLVLSYVVGLLLLLLVVSVFIPNIWQYLVPSNMASMRSYLQTELKATPTIIYVLLFAEVCFILGYFFLPVIFFNTPPPFSSLNYNGIKVLQEGQFMLNAFEEKTLATSNDLKVIDPEFAGNPFLKTYSISMWLYMNPKDEQTTMAEEPKPKSKLHTPLPTGVKPKDARLDAREVNVFFYGTQQRNSETMWELRYPKPCVTYTYDYGTKKNMLVIYSHTNEPYKLYIDLQKWNQLIFVFRDNHMDLFLNGRLEKSFPNTGTTNIFTEDDVIVVGDKHKEIYGAIADVLYYDYAMTMDDVVTSWNLQKYTIDIKT